MNLWNDIELFKRKIQSLVINHYVKQLNVLSVDHLLGEPQVGGHSGWW